jgi:hypothetical protein
MLHRPLGQVLAFRDWLGLQIPFDDYALNAALPQVDGETHANGAPPNDHDISRLDALQTSHFNGSIRQWHAHSTRRADHFRIPL